MMVNNLERVGRFGWIEIYDDNIMRIVNGVQFDVGIVWERDNNQNLWSENNSLDRICQENFGLSIKSRSKLYILQYFNSIQRTVLCRLMMMQTFCFYIDKFKSILVFFI